MLKTLLGFGGPRFQLLLCAGLDASGLWAIYLLIGLSKPWSNISDQLIWIVFLAVTYLGLGWLFGSYTVLRWPTVPLLQGVRRTSLAVVSTVAILALVRLAINPPESVWVVHRSTQMMWIFLQLSWSLTVRGLLRLGLISPETATCVLVADEQFAHLVMKEWLKTPTRYPLVRARIEEIKNLHPPALVAIQSSLEGASDMALELSRQNQFDPRNYSFISPLALVEAQLERLPPSLLPDFWIGYGDIPWSDPFSLQRQLKRVFDLVVAVGLLLVFLPVMIIAALIIWVEDGGPVLYAQERTGWMGKRFVLFKLRTMRVDLEGASVMWTVKGDKRITNAGKLLRRLRLDELPQLISVIKGDMSLIGPRPERPELEHDLESHIPHYRKRHWMRPGLSGWAQVSAPYAASIEDSDLKLSYDLYYIKNFTTLLDLLILFKTVKTVLKAGGR